MKMQHSLTSSRIVLMARKSTDAEEVKFANKNARIIERFTRDKN